MYVNEGEKGGGGGQAKSEEEEGSEHWRGRSLPLSNWQEGRDGGREGGMKEAAQSGSLCLLIPPAPGSRLILALGRDGDRVTYCRAWHHYGALLQIRCGSSFDITPILSSTNTRGSKTSPR